MSAMRVVVAEDDASIRHLVVHHLTRDGLRCDEAADGPTALRLARGGADLLILDVGLPVLDGFEVVRVLRREGSALPILFLTARGDEIDRIVGLEIGADDYVTKPFSPRELVARVRAVARRAGIERVRAEPSLFCFQRLEIDEAAHEARVDGTDIHLKPREFSLLLELARNPGVALSRTTLLENVWGFDYDGDERTVDVHVRRLRLKLEDRAGLEGLVKTVHGLGYKFTLT